ncbi:hypothetical protein OHB26_00330 [Nocardia sp. NBC_01503]|uniref:hypothetical protein n=1 Tax=Nocardia sp. NBC_01503 TaxID=2975997 RepID=UPI002E7AB5B7|nr:hypothetical protein [Nocardia sp. NBC_01503]WTL32762.1 hypothetical protein OHB26_00330 [Nocardia sp. NBC_01503]
MAGRFLVLDGRFSMSRSMIRQSTGGEGAPELAGTMGGRLLAMAQHAPEFAGEAAAKIDRAIAHRRPDRWRSSVLDKLAEARLIEGEFAEACRVGHQALTDAEKTGSDRVRVQLREMYTRTEKPSNVRSMAALRDRMRPLLASTI